MWASGYQLRFAPLSVAVIASGSPSGTDSKSSADANRSRVDWALKHQPLSFVENRGQADSRVDFYVAGPNSALYFTPQGVTFVLVEGAKSKSPDPIPPKSWTVKMDFVGARLNARPTGETPAPTLVSYFKGSPDRWKTGLRTFSRIRYTDLWPGIDLIYTGADSQLKYEFEVKPGADPGLIKWTYRGAPVSLDPSGNLQVTTPIGGFQDQHPYSYQAQPAGRATVMTSFDLRAGPTGDTVCAFRVGPYNHSRSLVIDPAVISYSGYIGGRFVDTAFGIAVDSSGAAYVTGYTESFPTDNFPLTVGPGLSFNLNKQMLFWTAFVAKVKADGSGLQYCGYIDGAGHQLGSAIAVDSAGAAYVTGFTTSDQTSFPVTVGPSLTFGGGTPYIGDAFVAKVKPDGTGLEYCGYIGGRGEDAGYGIAVDGQGNAYVTGETNSPGPSQAGSSVPFPARVGPSLTNASAPAFNSPDAFIVKVKADGTGLVYGGFIGGTGVDRGLGVAVDSAGSAYVTGVTNSPPSGFAGLSVGPSLTFGGGTDAFVAKVKPDGSGLNYCGYIGGAAGDTGTGIAVDSAGNAYITGETNSDPTTFPVKVGPRLTYSGGGDAFVAKLDPSGASLVYCGYIGGSGADSGYRIAVDSSGSAYIAGSTTSSQSTFPVTAASGRDASYSGGSVFGDAFLAKIDGSGANILYAGYIGGSSDDAAIGVALDSSANVYVAGGTLSSEATFPVAVGPFLHYQPGEFGEADAFVAKITGLLQPAPDFALSFAQSSISTPAGSKVSVTLNIARTGGFNGAVSISAPSTLPRGFKIPLDSTPITDPSITFKIKVKGTAQSGTDQLVFTGMDQSGKLTRTATLTLTVQ
jgi:hypothetical protein